MTGAPGSPHETSCRVALLQIIVQNGVVQSPPFDFKDDLPLCTPTFNMPVSLYDLIQRIALLNNWSYFLVLHKPA